MRILIVTDKFGLLGGAYVAMSRLAKLLVSLRHDVAVFYSHAEPPEQILDPFLLDKIKLFPIRYKPSVWRVYVGDKRIARNLADTIKIWRPDIIHIGNIYSVLTPEVIVVSHSHNIPTVFHICDHKLFCMNGYGFLDSSGEHCERCIGGNYRYGLWYRCGGLRGSWLAYVGRHKYHRLWNAIDAFAVPCDTSDKALDFLGVPMNRCLRMWYPIPEDEFIPSDTIDGKIVYYSNSYTKLKGLNMLVKACQYISSGEVYAYLIPNSIDVEQRKRELEKSASSKIHIFTHINWQSGLDKIVASARAVIIPSLWPTVGEGALFQAMIMQKAIIASNRGAHKEILKHEETALLFNPRDPFDLARCIGRAFKDDELCRKLGRQARVWAIENLASQAYYKKLLTLYEMAINERRARSLSR